MKKIIVLFVLILLAVIEFDFVNVRADSTAIGLGFSVDSTQYGNAKDYRYSSSNHYIVKDGVSYMYGWSRLKAAVYEDQTDSNWALVIMQTSVEPKDVKIPKGIFNILVLNDVTVRNQNLYSDIDNAFVNFGYGAYITSSGALMEQPSPRETPDTVTYTVSVEVSEVIKASGSVSFDNNELDLAFTHLFSTQVFEVDYIYSCNWGDCSYMNASTYNKGAYLVDMTNANSSTAGTFVNKIYMTTTFWVGPNTISGSYYYPSMYVLIFY